VSRLKTGLPYVLLIGAAGLLIIGTLNTGHDWGGDFSSYIMQAKSLVEGSPLEFVEANQFTIEHSERHIAPVAYPWGYPAMLAPVYAEYGQDLLALKSVGAVCYLLFLTLLAVIMRKQHKGVWLVCLIGLFALNPTLLAESNRLNSDVPFMLFSTLCVVLIGKFVVERRRFISPSFDGILLGFLIALTCMIRTNGVMLMATLAATHAVVLVPMIRRRPVAVDHTSAPKEDLNPKGSSIAQYLWINALPYASFLIITLLYRALLPSGESTQLIVMKDVSLGGMWYHVHYYSNMLAEFYDVAPLPYLVYLASLPLVIVGVIQRFRNDHPMVVYVVLTFSLYVVYPPLAGFRFLLPILPFYISFMLSGLEALQGGTVGKRPTLRSVLCLLPLAFILVCFAVLSTSNARDNLNRNRATLQGPFAESSSAMFSFIKQETDPDSTLAFYKPRVMRMMTGRKAYLADEAEGLGLADYLIVSFEKERQFSPEAAERLVEQGLADRVFANTGFRVYRMTGR